MATPFSRWPQKHEGEPYATIEFHVIEHGGFKKYMMECNLRGIRVEGLKEDFQSWLGISGDKQKWYLQGRLLLDDETLWEQGIGRWSDDVVIIEVRES